MNKEEIKKSALNIATEELSKLSSTEIENIGTKEKKSHVKNFILFLFCFISSLLGLILLIYYDISGILLCIFIILTSCTLISTCQELYLLFKKKNYHDWTKHKLYSSIYKKIEREEKEKLEEIDRRTVDGKDIKKVIILDSFTETTNKLHAFLNWEEIIHTRIYKFKVFFEDNSSAIYTTKEDSKLYNKLIVWVSKEENESTNTIDSAEQLRKYKALLDDKIISEEEFNKKKEELLNK